MTNNVSLVKVEAKIKAVKFNNKDISQSKSFYYIE